MVGNSSKESAIQFKVSPALKKEICRNALERNETVRAFILRALKEQGIAISDTELIDRRRGVVR